MRLFYFLRRLYYRHVYLQSRHWREFRLTALEAADWECEWPTCQTTDPHHPELRKKLRMSRVPFPIKSLDVHHLHYRSLWHEELKDVAVFCRAHHEEVEKLKR